MRFARETTDMVFRAALFGSFDDLWKMPGCYTSALAPSSTVGAKVQRDRVMGRKSNDLGEKLTMK